MESKSVHNGIKLKELSIRVEKMDLEGFLKTYQENVPRYKTLLYFYKQFFKFLISLMKKILNFILVCSFITIFETNVKLWMLVWRWSSGILT